MQQALEVREGAPCSLPPGLLLLEIAAIRKARTEDGGYRMNAQGEFLLEVVFKNAAGQSGSIFAYAGGKSQYIWDNLCKAVRVNNLTKKPSATELIGKKLYVMCLGYVRVVDGVIEDTHYKATLTPKFYIYSENVPKPKLFGDPTLPNVKLGGEFLRTEIYTETEQEHEERSFGDL